MKEYSLSKVTKDMVTYAYTNYTAHSRDSDWSIRTNAAYMATDWRYGIGILHKMRIRNQLNP